MNKILIAEDNAVNRELLRELLEARGYAVDEACDGQEALDMIAQNQPDILLLDIGMPVLNARALTEELERLFGTRENRDLPPDPPHEGDASGKTRAAGSSK